MEEVMCVSLQDLMVLTPLKPGDLEHLYKEILKILVIVEE